MQTIILATDFSKTSENAGRYAYKMARFFSARLILVHAYKIPAEEQGSIHLEDFKGIIEEQVFDKMREFKKIIPDNLNEQVPLLVFAEEGSPNEVIDLAIKKFKGDLIIMGVSGEDQFIKELTDGNCSVNIARENAVYSLLIPEGASFSRIHKLALACDLENTEGTTIPYVAKYFGKVFDAKLEIINVNTSGKELPEKKRDAIEFLDSKLKTIEHETQVLKGSSPAKDITNYVKQSGADILMVAPKQHNFLYYLFNKSVTSNLSHHAQIPVLVIH